MSSDEMWTQRVGLLKRVGRLEDRLKALETNCADHEKRLGFHRQQLIEDAGTAEDHEKRLKVVEDSCTDAGARLDNHRDRLRELERRTGRIENAAAMSRVSAPEPERMDHSQDAVAYGDTATEVSIVQPALRARERFFEAELDRTRKMLQEVRAELTATQVELDDARKIPTGKRELQAYWEGRRDAAAQIDRLRKALAESRQFETAAVNRLIDLEKEAKDGCD